MNLQQIRKQRKIARTAFTKLYTKVIKDISEKSDLSDEFHGSYQLLQEKYHTLRELENKVLAILIEDPEAEESEVFEEQEAADEYFSRWLTLEAKVKRLQKEEESTQSTSSQDTRRPRGSTLKLPQLKLVQFNGDIRNWVSFWGQFEKIHTDLSLDDHDKFQYLLSAIPEDSPARKLIDSFPPSAVNYTKAVEQLKQRFGREDLLIEVYMRDLLSLVLLQAKDRKEQTPLSSLYDQLTTQLRALESLGLTNDKYAVMLYPLVESALPDDILKAWEREWTRSGTRSEKGKLLNDLLAFLKHEVESSQRIEIAKHSFTKDLTASAATLPTTTACLVAGPSGTNRNNNSDSKDECIWCNKKSHTSLQCFKAANLSLDDKRLHIKKIKACANCLKPGHTSFRCKTPVKCLACLKRHNVLFCPELPKINKSSDDKDVKNVKDDDKNTSKNKTSLTNSSLSDKVTLLQTLLVKIQHKSKEVVVRALIDSGAQSSYIKRDVAEKLDLPVVGEKRMGHVVFGGLETKQVVHRLYDVIVSSVDGTYNISMRVLDEHRICGDLPRVCECRTLELLWKHGIALTDVGRDIPDIGLLIGADYCGALLTGHIVQLDNGLTAVRTKLGWTIQGMKSSMNNCSTTSLHIADLWELEALGIRDPAETKDKEKFEKEIMESFESSIKINEELRYEVHLPWKECHTTLHTNRELAERRLKSTTKRLISTDNYEAYDNVFTDWEAKGIIEEVHDDDKAGHYLAHHAVVKESSATTRIRPVFDASAKDKSGNSLNNCLEKGINLLELIPKLLIQFRLNPVGVTADIEKAFLQISLVPDDRNFLKFLWWKTKERRQMKIYRHCRVVFGLTCSPFLLGATIRHHLQQSPPELNGTANRLLRSFYVDNCVTSLEDKDVDEFVTQAKELMHAGKFNLREWVVAPKYDQVPEKTSLSILGVTWNTTDDTLYTNVSITPLKSLKRTRRSLLSVTQRVFDPIGFTAPTTLVPKLLMHEAWQIQGGWDDELPRQIADQFMEWWEQIRYLSECHIPRRLVLGSLSTCKGTLHVFSDASQKSYGCCIFLRTVFEGKVTVQLVLAKSRVAPSKAKITIPRLELIAALISTRLCIQAREALQVDYPIYYWSDSTVALTWIKREAQWAVFVQNRVNEIRINSKKENWRFVPGSLNPADLPSRGCDPKALLESLWWEGPRWLYEDESQWPQPTLFKETVEAEVELKKSRLTNELINTTAFKFTDRLLYFSKYNKILRMFAWLLRFIKRVCKKTQINITTLSSDETAEAEKRMFKLIQEEMSYETRKGKQDLVVFKDEQGILRVQTKLLFAEETDNFKWPILLPGKNMIVERLVRQKHDTLCHAGVTTLMTVLRESYWIVGVRRLAKKVISQCMKCQRFKAQSADVPFAPLPMNRVNHCAAAFQICGIDYAGPLILKSKEKAYVVLFTCAVYRAVHFELTTSLSTEAFLMALRRFAARRGRVSTIYTDNGTNFVGASNLLKRIDWSQIQTSPEIHPIKWIFNPPTAAWWGGWWERLVRSLKELLRRVLGKAVVSFIELQTVLCDCEAVINSRPLTYVTEADILTPLTPNDFIQSLPRGDIPEIDVLNEQSLNDRVRYMQKLRDDFRQRFRSEYLAMLVQRGKTRSSTILKTGDVVLIETPEKRITWPLGVIQELLEGKDGNTRVARVRTSHGVLTRPIQRLYLLEAGASVE